MMRHYHQKPQHQGQSKDKVIYDEKIKRQKSSQALDRKKESETDRQREMEGCKKPGNDYSFHNINLFHGK